MFTLPVLALAVTGMIRRNGRWAVAALAWAAIFDPSPPQYKKVSQQYMPLASVAPACAVTTGCEVLAMEGWSLLISLEPQDQRRFSPAQLRIHPLGETPAADWLALARSASHRPRAPQPPRTPKSTGGAKQLWKQSKERAERKYEEGLNSWNERMSDGQQLLLKMRAL